MANTTAPLSEVGVVAMAGDLLDEFNISSLDENTPFARFASRQFGYVRDEVLQLYPWHTAIKREQLAATEAPAFGWSYAYTIPADALRVHPIRSNGELDGAMIPFEIEAGQILTNQPAPLKIRYTFRLTNLSKWRPLMARVFAARLAMYGATRVTGKDSYYQKAKAEFDRTLFEAAHADSLERGTTENYWGSDNVFSARGLTEW